MSRLDYSPLVEPVTQADIDAYKQHTGQGLLPKMSYSSIIIIAMLSFLILQPMLYTLSTGNLPYILGSSYWVVIVIGGLYFVYRWMVSALKRRAKLYKFALRNGLQLFSDMPDPGYGGMIFDNGHSRKIKDMLRFSNGTEIGNYRYETGGGKNRTTHEWAYAKIKLTRRLPHMILDAKKNNFWKFSNLSDSFDRSQVLKLEGNFDTYFTLYVPKQYERDALYVFTPDVMAAMIDHGQDYDIEIVDDELFIYSKQHFQLDVPEFYEHLLAIIDVISSEITKQSDYYADERVGDRTVNLIAPEGRRLKSRFNWLLAFIFLLYIYFTFIHSHVFQLLQ